MTLTPVTSAWESQLAKRSLPGDMPWPDSDETVISEQAAKTLDLGSDPDAFMSDEVWLPQPAGMVSGRRFVLVIGAGETAQAGSRLIRYQATPTGIASAAIIYDREQEAQMEALGLHHAIATIKDQLGIDADDLVELLGMRRRTFFSHRKAGVLPTARIPEIRARVDVLAALLRDDADAAKTMVATRLRDVAASFASADYSGVRDLFRTVQHQLASAKVSPREAVFDALSEQTDQVAKVVAEPGFAAAADAFTSVSMLGDYPMVRLSALVDADQAVRIGHYGGELAERWEFLPTLSHAAMDAVVDRVRAYILSPDFTPDGWEHFVEAESERAWAAYNPVILPPDKPTPMVIEPDPEPQWEPDMAQFRVRTYSERVAR